MKTSVFFLVLAAAIFPAFALLAQSHPVHHSHTPNSPSNDLQLQLPLDQAQYCLTPESSGGFNEQFEQFDSFPQPASKGYLCINLPPGRPFVIDHLFAEADYDVELPTAAEWYLDTTVGGSGGNEQWTGFAATRAGSVTANPHYVLSQPVHLVVNGGTRVTLVMHNYFVNNSRAITETPGTASLSLLGHWE